MSYTERTTTSWFSRLKSAVAGIFIGIILVIGSLGALFWNEGRAIKTYRALVEGAGQVVSVAADTIDAGNEGKLIHISGPVTPGSTPEDDLTGLSAEGAVSLNRSVEMYQWVEEAKSETQKNVGGSEETVTTYDYKKEWVDHPVNSGDFKVTEGHENPPFPLESQEFAIPDGTVGAFSVPGNDLAALGESSLVKLSEDDVIALGDTIGFDRPVKLSAGKLYAGDSPSAPKIGDVTVSYTRGDLKEASFVARQSGEGLNPWPTSNGREIYLSSAGTVPADQMFADAQTENVIITWIIRVVGILVLFIGFQLMFSIFSVIGDVIPFIGSIIGFGTSMISLMLTASLGPLAIAIGWFAYRPLIAIAVLAAGAAVVALVIWLRRGKAAATPAKA